MKLRKVDFRLVTALVILLAAAGIVATRVTAFRKGVLDQASAEGARLARHDPAPEFAGIKTWINSEPLTMLQLRGKVVLIDFWTYSCVNCIRTLPELRALYSAYKSAGLEIVGVHSPEFNFEKEPANVRRAVAENKVTWPVAMDNAMDTWNAYSNQYWPHVFLIDRKGLIRFDHIGEGGSADIETAVRALLYGRSASTHPSAMPSAYTVPDTLTPEIYLGYDRGEPSGFLGNPGGYTHDREHDYKVPANTAGGTAGTFYLGGTWLARGEFVGSATSGAQIVLPFTGQNVYVVAGAPGDAATKVSVLVDGKPVDASRSGTAVAQGTLRIGPKDLYQILHLPGVESHTLTLTFADTDVQVYTFTFG